MTRAKTYRSARNCHLNLSTGSAHQLAKLGADTSQQRQTVVLGQRLEEVLDGLAADAGALLELGNDGRLVGSAQHRRAQDGCQLGVLGNEVAELGQGGSGRVQRRGLDGGRVLLQNNAIVVSLAVGCSSHDALRNQFPSIVSSEYLRSSKDRKGSLCSGKVGA